MPRVLGLSASIVVKTVKVSCRRTAPGVRSLRSPQVREFRAEKAALEKVMDSVVETAEELALARFVSSAMEEMVGFQPSPGSALGGTIGGLVVEARQQLAATRLAAEAVIRADERWDANTKQTSLDSLKKDFKYFSNDVFGTICALLELGLYSVRRMMAPLRTEVERKREREEGDWYDPAVKEVMAETSLAFLEQMRALAGEVEGPGEAAILASCSAKVRTLVEVVRTRAAEGEMRCIVFVERKLVAQALALLLAGLRLPGVAGVDFAYSASKGRNVKDEQDRKAVSSIKRKVRETLASFRSGGTNVLVSTSVVEEGLDIPSCNLVIKFDFPTTFRSYIQSKGRARKAGSRYVLLVEEGDREKEKSYWEWKEVYRMSMRECHSRATEEEEAAVVEGEEEFYDTGVARVTGGQATVLINQYLQRIPTDNFTRCLVCSLWSVSINYSVVCSL